MQLIWPLPVRHLPAWQASAPPAIWTIVMKYLIACFAALFLSALPAKACPDPSELVAKGVEQQTAELFVDDMEAMQLEEFIARYCALDGAHRAFAAKIYGSAFAALDDKERQTLVRMAIMVQGMAAHVAHVVEKGALRSVDDEWESTAILRFLHHLRAQFPATKSLLDEPYLAQMDAQFQKALDHVRQREQDQDRKINQAREQITELEKQKAALLDAIEGMKDERLKFRGMRQELEAQKQ